MQDLKQKKIYCEIGKSCETDDCILWEMKLLRVFIIADVAKIWQMKFKKATKQNYFLTRLH